MIVKRAIENEENIDSRCLYDFWVFSFSTKKRIVKENTIKEMKSYYYTYY